MVDIEKFVRTELRSLRTPIFFPNRFIRGFAYRLLGVSLAFHGNITFRDAIRNFLPSRFKAPETDEKIFSSIRREFDSIIKSKSLHTSTSAMLFGNQIFPAHESSELESWLHTCIMIFQSVVADQYHARRFLKPDSIVIDAGANMGIFSLFSALCAPYGHVYAFEPSPKTYEILLKNTGNNSCISTYNSALGEKEGSGNLILAESSGSNTLSDSGIGQPHAFGEIKVPITTIDVFVHEKGITRIDFIKMDTEGYERNIIQGARETIARFSPILSLSAYHHTDDKKEIPRLIQSINPRYKYKISKSVEENLLFYVD